MLSFDVKPLGNLTVLYLKGDLNLDGALALKEKIQEVRKSGVSILILNCSGINKVTSSVLQHIVSPIRALTLVNGIVALCNMSGPIHKFMQTAMFYSMVVVYDTEEQAIQDLTQTKEKGK